MYLVWPLPQSRSRFHFVFHARLQTFFNGSPNCSFALYPKQQVMAEEKKHARYFCWPRIIASFISQALRFQCGRTLGEKLTFGSDPMTHTCSISTFPKSHFTSSTPHPGGFCHELTHFGSCYLHKLQNHIGKWLGKKRYISGISG